VPESIEKVQFHICRRGVVDADPASDEKNWMELSIPWLDVQTADIWPDEFIVATFQLADGSWEKAQVPELQRTEKN
jgi:hypothetical protein